MNYTSLEFWFGFVLGIAVMVAFIHFKEWQYDKKLNKECQVAQNSEEGK